MRLRGTNKGNHNEHEEQRAIIQWPNTQASACVETAEVSIRVLCVQQNSGDEEAREYKEEINSHPAVASDEPGIQIFIGIVDKDRQHGQATNRVELREALHFMTRLGTVILRSHIPV